MTALVAWFKLFTPSLCTPTWTHINVSKAKKVEVMHLQPAFTSVDFLVDYWPVCHRTLPPRVAAAWLHFLLARHISWNYAKPWTGFQKRIHKLRGKKIMMMWRCHSSSVLVGYIWQGLSPNDLPHAEQLEEWYHMSFVKEKMSQSILSCNLSFPKNGYMWKVLEKP